MGVFNHSGSRVICFFLPAGPTMAVRNSSASSVVIGSSCKPTNSVKEGTACAPSLKYVGRRLGAFSGALNSVANDREDIQGGDMMLRDACRNGGAFKHLNLLAAAAIVCRSSLNVREMDVFGEDLR